MLSEVNKFRFGRDVDTLQKVALRIIGLIENYDRKLLDIEPTPAETIIKSSGQKYGREDYVADIVQFLSCQDVVNFLR
jgi:hypothetical protein